MFYIYMDGKLIYQPLNSELHLITPKLKVEMGKAGSLEFSIPSSNKYYNMIQQLKTGFVVEMDDEEIFRGRALSIERNFNNVRNVYGEGNLAYLVDSVQKAEKYHGSAHTLFRNIIEAHNNMVEPAKRFVVGSITVDDRDVILAGQSEDIEDAETGAFDYHQIAINSVADEWQTTYDYFDTCLLTYIGGYLRTRYENGVNYIDWLKDYNSTATQEIEIGKNMLDLTEEVSADDIFTVLIPLGDENLTIESVNNGSIELVNSEAVARFGRIVKTHVFSGVNQPSTLLENGQRYLANHVNAPVTITVTAVDLHLLNPDIQPIRLGDKVRVVSPIHNMVDYLTCTRIEYDLSNPANNVYTFGEPKQSLTERYRRDKNKKEDKSGGGGGAGEKAQEKIDDGLKDFYDAWINVEEEAAHIDLGTLYKHYENQKLVLKRDCGIDVDGVSGNINIKTLSTKFDEAEEKISDNTARISLLQKDTESKIELATAYAKQIDDREEGHYASLSIWANEKESVIAAKADKVTVEALEQSLKATDKKITDANDILTKQVGIDMSGKNGNVNITTMAQVVDEHETKIIDNKTSIENVSSTLGSRITAVAQASSDNGDRIASLDIRATRLESSITLKADKVSIEALETSIDNLKTGRTKATTITSVNILADNVQTDALYLKSVAVPNANHSHEITESNGQITLGYATNEKQSFKIADTKAYKEGVSAAAKAVKIYSIELEGTPLYVKNTKEYVVSTIATASNENIRRGQFRVSAEEAYSAGFIEGQGQGGQSGYEEGYNAVTIDSIERETEDLYSRTNNTFTISLIASASNGKVRRGQFSISGKKAFDYGSESVSVYSITNGGRVGSIWQDENGNRFITLKITATASNGSSKTQNINTGVGDVYTSGVDAGRVGYTKGTFTAVDVTVQGSSMTRYRKGSTVTGTNLGRQYASDLYYKRGSTYYKSTAKLYYAGTAYSHTLVGDAETVYGAGSSKTYYTKS